MEENGENPEEIDADEIKKRLKKKRIEEKAAKK